MAFLLRHRNQTYVLNNWRVKCISHPQLRKWKIKHCKRVNISKLPYYHFSRILWVSSMLISNCLLLAWHERKSVNESMTTNFWCVCICMCIYECTATYLAGHSYECRIQDRSFDTNILLRICQEYNEQYVCFLSIISNHLVHQVIICHIMKYSKMLGQDRVSVSHWVYLHSFRDGHDWVTSFSLFTFMIG